MAISNQNNWQYREGCDPVFLPDPRSAIARHIQWTRPPYGKEYGGLTDWSVPEPDAYNVALFGNKPLDCPFVMNQIFYYDAMKKGWFSVYLVDKEQKMQWLIWKRHQDHIAYWVVFKDSQVRKSKKMLGVKARKNSVELTLNEVLAQQNYYVNLLNKVEGDAKSVLIERIGEKT